MEALINWVMEWFCSHAASAHYIIFALLVLKGFNLPFSEKVLGLICGILASAIIPSNGLYLFLALFLGCYVADWITYFLGRLAGEKLYDFPVLKHLINEKNKKKIKHFYERHGIATLLIGHFTPFGLRNGIFMSAGISHMPFLKFGIVNWFGCLIFSVVFFFSAYFFGQNYHLFMQYIHKWEVIFLSTLAILCVGVAIFYWREKLNKAKELAS